MQPRNSRLARPKFRWRWFIVAAMSIAALSLGILGFAKHAVLHNIDRTPFDIVYESLQLFTLESGNVDPPIPASLQIARFLAPVAAAYALVVGLIGAFSDQWRRMQLRLTEGHVIVCGLGRKGIRLVEQLRERGDRVVVIEPDGNNPALAHCRDLNCLVIVGRADDAWNLRDAFLDRASLLVATAGDDGANVETAVMAHQLVANRSGKPLRCVLHISDPGLQSLFKQHELFTDQRDQFEPEFFNVYEAGARVMLREASAIDRARPRNADEHVLIVGMGLLGETLLVRLIKDWRADWPDSGGRLRVTVIDQQADVRERWLNDHYPHLQGICTIEFITLDARNLAVFRGASKNWNDVTHAFVCMDNDAAAMHAALDLRRQLPDDVHVTVRMSEEAGLATLVGSGHDQPGVIEGVTAVGLMDIACSLEMVLGGAVEIIAQAIHQAYLRDRLNEGKSPDDGDESFVPWHRLPTTLKRSNRDQAVDLIKKLQAIGCRIRSKALGLPQDFAFTSEELEQLAKLEHDRWFVERVADGWTRGETKDVAAKRSPYIVSWDELAESVREIDRGAVRRIPQLLAKVDYEIVREPL